MRFVITSKSKEEALERASDHLKRGYKIVQVVQKDISVPTTKHNPPIEKCFVILEKVENA